MASPSTVKIQQRAKIVSDLKPLARLRDFMRGWKVGAGSGLPAELAGDYQRGYQAGVAARIREQKRASRELGVTRDELEEAVLR